MNIAEVMQQHVHTCGPTHSLTVPARIMWEQDCGSVPVVDQEGRLLGMITDRDICMAAYLRGQRLDDCVVGDVMSRPAVAARSNDSVADAELKMRDNRVRRLPVTDDSGQITGIVSLNDLVLASRPGARRQKDLAPDAVVSTMAVICEHRRPSSAAA